MKELKTHSFGLIIFLMETICTFKVCVHLDKKLIITYAYIIKNLNIRGKIFGNKSLIIENKSNESYLQV